MPTTRKLLISLLLAAALPIISQPINPISRRVRGFAATPATCNFAASVVDFGVNTTTNVFYVCTSTGWLAVGNTAGTVTSVGNGTIGTLFTVTWATATTTPALSIDITNQGTTTTVLHGNAAGHPAFGSVVSADMNITTTTCTNQFLRGITSTAGGTCSALADTDVGALTKIGKVTLTQPATAATLTILNNKTLTANNSLTLAGTDGTTVTFPTTSAAMARTDAANTLTGQQDVAGSLRSTAITAFASGVGLEMEYSSGTGFMRAYDRTGAAYQNLSLNDNLSVGGGASGNISTSGTFNKYTLTAPATGATLTILNGKTATFNNSIVLAGTDSTTMTFPATSASIARIDAAQTFTGVQTLSSNPIVSSQAMTAGTMTVTNSANAIDVIQRFDWTNAMVVALGGVTAGDITVCTLPAKTVVKNMYVVIDTPDTSTNALTVAVGRVSATFIDYIVASDAKASANTVYGDASGERGTNLVGYDLPSITSTTAVRAHFIKTTTNLSTVLGSTGHVYIETMILP